MPQCSQLSRDWGQEWFLEFCITYLKLITKILNVNIRGIRANSLDISFIMQKKKGKCWKKKNTLENDSLFILKQSGLTDLHPFTDQKIYPEHATSQGSQI